MGTQDIHHLLLVYGAYLVAVASPGPSTMAIMGVAMQQGRAPAVVLALGVMAGSLFWAALAATGLSAVLTGLAGALVALKIAGGLYLLYLAWKSARSALSPDRDAALPQTRTRPGGLFRRGALLHVTNPKSILGWIAIMTLGLRPDSPPYTLAAILAGCAVLGLTVFVGYALVFSLPPMGRAYRRARCWIEGTLAMVFGYAGIRLLLSRG